MDKFAYEHKLIGEFKYKLRTIVNVHTIKVNWVSYDDICVRITLEQN